MIEKFFTQQQTLFRMREGILGPHLPMIAKALDEAHYSTATIRLHLRAADHFGVWLQEKSIAVADVSLYEANGFNFQQLVPWLRNHVQFIEIL